MIETTANDVVAIMAAGMGFALMTSDRNSSASRFVGLALIFLGVAICMNVHVEHSRVGDTLPWWTGLAGVADALAAACGYEWILRIRRMLPTRGLRTRFGDLQLRAAQGLAAIYAALSLVFPAARVDSFLGQFEGVATLRDPWFLTFALPMALSIVLAFESVWLVLQRKPDPAERTRLIGLVVALPLIGSGLVLPLEQSPIPASIGLVIFLLGAIRYHVFQGARAEFMKRFLAPDVAEMVGRRGLQSAMEESTLEISVVAADLRNFTAYAARSSSESTLGVLRQYYDAVGQAATEFGATIKDHAGDGVLLLVGAPIPHEDHTHRAVDLARRLRDRVSEVLAQVSADGAEPLGVGVGVATGLVTVGIISGANRLEYAAVGSAVNLASRLADQADAGEILIAAATVEKMDAQRRGAGLSARDPLQLKGFAEAVPNYAMA